MNLRLLCTLVLVFIPVSGCSDPESPLRFKGAGLLILSIDTLRADRLGCYGNTRGLTPTLDALADESVLFEEVYANSPKTASSHMSLFTSMLPTVHGVTNFSPRQKIPLVTLAENRVTLGQVLKESGYWTSTVACGGNIQAAMGFQRGFGRHFLSTLLPVETIVDKALQAARLAKEQKKPPFFFVHTYQVHAPYVPPPEYRERFAPEPRGVAARLVDEMKDLSFQKLWGAMHSGLWDHQDEFGPEDAKYLSELYDGEVAYTDHVLDQLFSGLRQMGLLDRMIVVVLSDHGEEFQEHGKFEHDQLFQEHLHVPVIMRLPGGALAGTRVKGMASLIDIMPTLLDLLEIRGPEEQMMGRSLVPSLRTLSTGETSVFSERVMYADDYQAALRTASESVIFHAREGRLEAYDLRDDPSEKLDRAWKAPFFSQKSQELKKTLTRVFAERVRWDQGGQGRQAQLDAKAREELSQLGYLDNDAGAVSLPTGSPLQRWPAGPPTGEDKE